ncbi:hypothetical protein [Streptomyces sp. NBC_01363]|uniref:hypothetical protein n=1 Tax=Streptomyces sp. NBC_01363 TaxID=2903840 RepID=UPI00224FFC5E|nr:hypothetical protein [Streptomyces sp. NBC_01363]MCX4729801.1 hypothetical protein [Streptomyces sp. NBC_01363]
MLTAAYTEDQAQTDGVEMLLTVEDPSKATKKDPAQVEVTAVAPVTDEAVTTTADVTKPRKAEDVAGKAIDKTVAEVVTPAVLVLS